MTSMCHDVVKSSFYDIDVSRRCNGEFLMTSMCHDVVTSSLT